MGTGCAHALTLPDGNTYTRMAIIDMGSLATQTDYQIVRIPQGTSTRKVVATVRKFDDELTYAHSFAMPNASLAVLPYWPLGMTKVGALTRSNLHSAMRWKPEQGTNLTVLDMNSGRSVVFTCNETFFSFHITNSFVDPSSGDIVVDLVTYDDDSLFVQMFLDSWRNGTGVDHTSLVGTLKRIVIPYAKFQEEPAGTRGTVWYSSSFLGTKSSKTKMNPTFLAKDQAQVTTLTSVLIEGPRINDKYLTNPELQYVYAWTSTRNSNIPNSLVKVDLTDGEVLSWKDETDEFSVYIGEPVFIAAPNAVAEDDGVVIAAGVQYDADLLESANSSFLLVLNATTMEELGRASREGITLPFAFHTQFYSSS